MTSVLNPWVQELTFMQQTVLLCAVRNHDGFNKHNPAKDITRYLRRVILCSAFDGRMLSDPHEGGGGNFTGPLKHKSVYDAVTAFLDGRDEMSLHYWLHAVHAFEIVGYMCPHETIRRDFFDAYHRCVSAMHLEPESSYAMCQRLSDNPEKWLARSDAYEREQFHKEQLPQGTSLGLNDAALSNAPKGLELWYVWRKNGEYVASQDVTEPQTLLSYGLFAASKEDAIEYVKAGGYLADVKSDGQIYKEVSEKRASEHELQDAEDTLRKLANQPARAARSERDPLIRELSSEELATRHASFMSAEHMAQDDDEGVPAFAAVKDGHFVNAVTGMQVGHPFDLKWGFRIDEFPIYVEPELTVKAKPRERENGGVSDYEPTKYRSEHEERGWQPK